MTAFKIDAARLAVLRTVHDREKATVQATTDRVQVDAETSSRLRREIMALERAVGSLRDHEAIAAKRAEQQAVMQRIEDGSQSAEILRERSQAASRLLNRCVDWCRKNRVEGANV